MDGSLSSEVVSLPSIIVVSTTSELVVSVGPVSAAELSELAVLD